MVIKRLFLVVKNFLNQKRKRFLSQRSAKQKTITIQKNEDHGKVNNFAQLKSLMMNIDEDNIIYEKRIAAILKAKSTIDDVSDIQSEKEIKNIKQNSESEFNKDKFDNCNREELEDCDIEEKILAKDDENTLYCRDDKKYKFEDNFLQGNNLKFDNINFCYDLNFKSDIKNLYSNEKNIDNLNNKFTNNAENKVSVSDCIRINKDSFVNNIINDISGNNNLANTTNSQNIGELDNNKIVDNINLNEIEEEVKISDIVPVGTAIDITAAEFKEIKNENDKIEVNYYISTVVDYASMIPIEIIEDRYKINLNNCICPDKNIDDDGLLKLLKLNPYIESLDLADCDNIYNFKILEKFENLKELSVNDCNNFEDLDSISNCKNLVVLNIGNTKVNDITAVKNFKNLEIFNCSSNIIENVNALVYCKKLREIILWNCISIDNIDFISELKDVTRLDIDYTSVFDLNCLKSCKNLEILFMDNCNFIKDFSFLRSLNKLKCILADGTNLLTYNQLQNFSDLCNLEILTLNNRRIIDISSFSKLTKMKELIMTGCNLTDLAPLENLSEMTKIDLTANSMLKDLSPLYKMTELNKLLVGGGGQAKLAKASKNVDAVSNMSIENINVVRNFKKLKEINLSANNKLKDISALEVCDIMEEVYLQNCMQLENVDVLGKLKKLIKVYLSSNPRIKNLYFMNNLPDLLEFIYDGTSVYTPGLMSTFKKANNIYLLKGNVPDIVSGNILKSGKKKCKLQKSLRKFFKKK